MKLRVYDGVAVAALLSLPALFTTGLSTLSAQNGSAGWLALVIAFAAMAALFLLCTALMARFPGKGLLDIAATVAGRPVAAVCGIILGAYFCLFTGLHIRECAEVLKIYGLKLTPLWATAGLILLCAVMLCFFGGRAIVKTAGFFFVLILIGLALVLLLGATRYDGDRLVPLLGAGVPQVAKNGLMSAPLLNGALALLLLAPAFEGTARLRKSGMVALSVTAAAFLALFLGYISMFSTHVAGQMVSGFMEMGKSSYFNHFFYRFESVLLFFLIFLAAMGAALGLLLARESVSRAVGVRPARMLTLLCAAGVAVGIFLPPGMQALTEIYLPLLRQISLPVLGGIPLLLLGVSIIRRGIGHEEN